MNRGISRFSSLRFKFALALALFSTLLMVAVMLLLEQRLRETLVQESIDKGLGIARGLAFNTEDPLLAGDDLYLFSAVKNASRAPGVKYALILDRDRTIRADTVMNRIGSTYQPLVDVTAVEESDDFKVYRSSDDDGTGLLNLQVPIVTLGDKQIRIGEIHLGLSEALIRENIQKMRFTLAGLAFFCLGYRRRWGFCAGRDAGRTTFCAGESCARHRRWQSRTAYQPETQ